MSRSRASTSQPASSAITAMMQSTVERTVLPLARRSAVELRRPKVEVDAWRLEKDHVLERLSDRFSSLIAAEALEDLRDHYAARAHVLLSAQQVGEGVGRRGRKAVQEVHPGRRVDEHSHLTEPL